MSWTITSTSYFKQQYRTLPRNIKSLLPSVSDMLLVDPYDDLLRTHRLHRPLGAYYGISLDGEYRIIARIHDTRREIVLHDIGTHDIYTDFAG